MEEDTTLDLTAEMAALGLPSSFIAGLGHFPSTRRKKSRRKPSSSHTRTGTDDFELDGCTDSAESAATPDENGHRTHFCVRSVRLYTPKDPGLEEVEGYDALACSTRLQQETSLIGGDAANSPLCAAGTSERSEVDGFSAVEEGCVVDSVDVRWEPVWDEQYYCYYFCNTQTGESTWEPPPGFENYAGPSSLFADGQQTCSLVGTQNSSSLGLVCDEETTVGWGRDSGSSVCTIRGLVDRRDDDAEGRLSPVGKVEAMADCEEVLNGCRSETTDLIVKGSSLEEVLVLPGISNSHIRFGDSDESNSWSTGEGQDGGVDWTELRENENAGEEEKDGCEACPHSSQHLVSSFHSKVRQHSKGSEMRIKKRRLRSLSGDQLDEVQLSGVVGMLSKDLAKYWFQRYSLFTKFDEGVKMDEEGWFSVTPEIIAKHQASRCVTGLVIDAFTGVGGNAIQFAFKSYRVIAIDINPIRIEYARHNAAIYGVSDKIEFIVGDFFQLAPFLKADLVFLSPPWGGPEYLKQDIYDLHTMLKPKDGITLFKVARSIAPNIALFVPRNVDLNQLQELSWLTSPPLPCEVEENYVNDKLKAITAYYGDFAGQDL